MNLLLAIAVFVFMFGVAIAMAAIWVMLGFMPVIVPAIDQGDALLMYVGLASQLLFSIVTIMSARSIVVDSWVIARPKMTGKEKDLEFVDNWVLGTGLLLFLSSIAAPFIVGALLLVSPFMGLVGFAVTGAAVKGLLGWTNFSHVMSGIEVPSVRVRGLSISIVVIAVGSALAAANAEVVRSSIGSIHEGRTEAARSLSNEIAAMKSAAPRIIELLSTKVSIELKIRAHEHDAVIKGVGSQAAELIAELKEADSRIQLLNQSMELKRALSRSERELIEINRHLTALRSLAPALK